MVLSSMHIHHLQHVPFEGLGSMEPVLRARGDELSATHLYAGQSLPNLDHLDGLIVMGGPMGVHDKDAFPWLGDEKRFILGAIEAGKPVLGICLGAQLMADALGARVYRGAHREIGWFDISCPDESVLPGVFPEELEVFHWHGDTFDVPAGAKHLASSEACVNQGFVFDDRVVGLQFHLETTPDSATALIEHCSDELDDSRYVQTAEEMLSEPERFGTINRVMADLIEAMFVRD
ncbi:MAG: gamma-glutamyl-gamma-aminobutyrate hydrolase family protein [Verrucomicrobiota bacterium]